MNLKKNLYVVGNRIALLFGNCYIGENQPLPGCRKDVEELGKKLTDFDFTVHSKINLNLTQMGQEFDKILDELNSDDTVLFFFSGHGVEYKGVQYFIPVSMKDPEKEQDIMTTAFSCDLAIKRIAKKVTNGLKLIISDACRSEFKKVLNDIGSRTGNTYESININYNPNKPDKEYVSEMATVKIDPTSDRAKALCDGFSDVQPSSVKPDLRKLSVESSDIKKETKNLIRMCAVARGEKADAGYGNNLSQYTKALINSIDKPRQSIMSLNIRISKELWDVKPEIAIIGPGDIIDTFRFCKRDYCKKINLWY